MNRLLLALAFILIPQVCSAEIIWDYFSTDSITEVTGMLTTDGFPSALTSDGAFSLVSFDTVLVNGFAPTTWSFGGGPPFNQSPLGQFLWSASEGIGFLEIQGYGSVVAYDAIFSNSMQLGVPDWQETFVVGNEESEYYALFTPTETYFVPHGFEQPVVPEPATITLLLIGLLGLGNHMAKRSRKWG